MKRLFSSVLFYVLFVSAAFAAKVDTIEVFSKAMNKGIKTVTILPADYDTGKEFPVIYLLHGYGGGYGDWVNRAPAIKDLADKYSLIIVCPDGGKGSWYWDSPEDSSFKYETFVANELVNWVDSNLKTRKNREGRAITGLSMGGHGALYLAIKHQDVFGAAGSTAGGVDIRPFPNNWEIIRRLGPYKDNKDKWTDHTVMGLLHLLDPKGLKLFIDCGTSDFFYEVNKELHRQLTYLN